MWRTLIRRYYVVPAFVAIIRKCCDKYKTNANPLEFGRVVDESKHCYVLRITYYDVDI